MSGINDLKKSDNKDTMELLNQARINSPQVMLFEALAWLDAFSPKAQDGLGMAATAKWVITKYYIASLISVERALAIPVFRKITKNNESNSIGSSIARYFRYFWVDATATSGVVPAAYAQSVIKNSNLDSSQSNIFYRGFEFLFVVALKVVFVVMAIAALPLMLASAIVAALAYTFTFRSFAKTIMGLIGTELRNIGVSLVSYTNWNVLYPILVAVPGAVMKATLVSGAIVALPFMGIAAAVTGLANVSGLSKLLGMTKGMTNAYDGITSVIGVMFGLIATVPLSNLNPLIALKTIFFDTFASVAVVERLKSEGYNMKQQKELALKNLPLDRATSSSPNLNIQNIHKKMAPEITATFNIEGGLRTDLVTAEAKKISSTYTVERKSIAWGLGNAISRELVFQIRNPAVNKQDIIATIKLESGNNTLKLQFKDNASADDQVRIALNFTKMLQGVADASKSDAPIKLDLSNSDVKEQEIVVNTRGLKMVAPIKFVDQKQNANKQEDRAESSDQLELKNGVAEAKTENVEVEVESDDSRNSAADIEGDPTDGSSRGPRRGGIPPEFVRDHNKI
jgi:hypothetical protein